MFVKMGKLSTGPTTAVDVVFNYKDADLEFTLGLLDTKVLGDTNG